jgi:hypothetical protein
MSVEAATVSRLRPAALQAKPVRMPQVFADADEVMRLIRERVPYRTMSAFHQLKSSMGWTGEFPWFREAFEQPAFLHNPTFVAAAREAFSASIVRPTKCLINLNGPMRSGPPHLDLPVYRGFAAPAAPVWLLMNMTYSGLFHPWMVPIASGLAWFYTGEGGEFEYWPDGPQGRPVRETAPLWNVGVMSDNEFMWHRVGPIGPPEAQTRLHGHLRTSDLLHDAGGGAWEIRDGARTVERLGPAELRISILWKAQVFKDQAHLASFEDRGMDLDLAQVVDIYLADLERRGVRASRPADPLEDAGWRDLLQRVYVPPFDGNGP